MLFKNCQFQTSIYLIDRIIAEALTTGKVTVQSNSDYWACKSAINCVKVKETDNLISN
jgi:hypothetical protein